MSANQRDPTYGQTVPRASMSTFTASTPTYMPYKSMNPDNGNTAVPSAAPSGTSTFSSASRDTPREDRWDTDLESGNPKATGYSSKLLWSMGPSSGPVSDQKYGERLSSWQASFQKHTSSGAPPDAFGDVEAQGGGYDQGAQGATIWTRIGNSITSARGTVQDMYATNVASRTPRTQKGPPRNPGEIV